MPQIDFFYKNKEKTVIEISMFLVEVLKRGKGIGSKFYLEWEKNLPKEVELITLFAADTGDGNSDDFWEKLGFDFKYTADTQTDLLNSVGYEGIHRMWKGVNNKPTPQSIYCKENGEILENVTKRLKKN
jgi:hypothetical protein